jgi:hypothetical protein
MQIRLQELGRTITGCWASAESNVRQLIAAKYSFPSEEILTFLLSGELRCAVSEASNAGQFDRAFLKDLKRHVPGLPEHYLQRFAGLIGRVNFHTRRHEGKRSAADFGVAITRPEVRPFRIGQLQVIRDRTRGLLTQAKLGISNSKRPGEVKWGRLTRQQKTLITDLSGYYALLLYRLNDGRQLAPFAWQSCENVNSTDVENWLQEGKFPMELASTDIVNGLALGTFGTDSKEIVDRLIDPTSSRNTVEICITWPEGKDPPASITQPIKEKQVVKQIIQM